MLAHSSIAARAQTQAADGQEAFGLPFHASPRTPIKHVVVIYQENVSFDHYFGTYPMAVNPSGEPAFHPDFLTSSVNNLRTADLLRKNPNTDPANGQGAALPFRLDRSQAATADQNHAYTAEQMAYDGGKADLFPLYTGTSGTNGSGTFATKGLVLGYYDGNTVTALWNYAQRFAMSDNTYTDTYGPSTPGALEAVSGQTNGFSIRFTTSAPSTKEKSSSYINDGQGGLTMINDIDPSYDKCSSATDQGSMLGRNIGDLLNRRGISWGGFMGGFDLSVANSDGTTGCKRQSFSQIGGQSTADYIPHHDWFQYYKSTSNPDHLRPASLWSIGHSMIPGSNTAEPANHQYDLNDFYAALGAGNFPAVSYIKMPAFQDGHAGYSNPLDEQEGVVKLVNFIQKQPGWINTAIIVTYDDSDGWYDHLYTSPTQTSFDPSADQLNAPGQCGSRYVAQPRGVLGRPVNGRCGPGTRVPMIVISPWAKRNHISHVLTTQASIVRFIEDNWLGGERIGGGSFDAGAGSLEDMFDFHGLPHLGPLLLDPSTGSVTHAGWGHSASPAPSY